MKEKSFQSSPDSHGGWDNCFGNDLHYPLNIFVPIEEMSLNYSISVFRWNISATLRIFLFYFAFPSCNVLLGTSSIKSNLQYPSQAEEKMNQEAFYFVFKK